MPEKRARRKKQQRPRKAGNDYARLTLLELYFTLMTPSQSADDLRRDGFRPRNDTPPWPLAIPVDWSANPYNDDNWQYQFHAWRMIDPLLHEYQRTGNASAMHEALGYVVDWHRFHIREKRSAKYSWFDMSAGIRAIKIAALFEFMKQGGFDPPPASRAALGELAAVHARRLRDDSYIAMNNHGLWQVLGLRMLAHAALRGEDRSDARRSSTKHFKRILAFSYTPEGIHKEHSPSYAELVTQWVNRPAFRRWWPTLDADLVTNVQETAPWFAFPDGEIARLGDSVGRGRSGPLKDGMLIRPAGAHDILVKDLSKSGYVIVRSAPDTPADAQSMLIVTGACWSQTHKHVDDLSFELFEFGRKIFIDTGMFSYTRGPMRLYVLSADSHSTISLSDKQLLPKHVAVSGSSLEPIAVGDDAVRISGSVTRPSLFSQRRTITYAPGRSLLIHDELASDARHQYVSSLHLAPDLHPTPTDRGFTVDLGEGRSLSAEILDRDATVRIVRGQEDPPLGWSTVDYQKMEPTSVVQAMADGADRSITWRISFHVERQMPGDSALRDALGATRSQLDRAAADGAIAGLNALIWRIIRGEVDDDGVALVAEESRQERRTARFGDFPDLRDTLFHVEAAASLHAAEYWLDRDAAIPLVDGIKGLQAGFFRELADGPSRSAALSWIGLCYFILGEDSLGSYFMARGQASKVHAPGPFFYARSLCPRSIIPFAESETFRIGQRPIALPPTPDGIEGDKPVLLFSCDSRYLQVFFDNICASVRDHAPALFSAIHVHVVNPQPDMQEVIGRGGALLGAGIKVVASHEVVDNVKDMRSYYAIARFLHAAQLLDHYRRDLLISDMDLHLVSDPLELMRTAQDYDIMTLNGSGLERAYPWLKVNAGLLYARSNKTGRAFMKTFANAITMTFDPGASNWGIDQNALASVTDHFGAKGARLGDLSKTGGRHFRVARHLKRGL